MRALTSSRSCLALRSSGLWERPRKQESRNWVPHVLPPHSVKGLVLEGSEGEMGGA